MDLGEVPWLIHPRSRAVRARYVTHPEVRCVRSQGMLVACPSDSVIDLIRFWPPEDALTIAHRALQQRTVTLDHLAVGHARLMGLGGLAQLGHVIAEAADGTRSEAERRLVDLLRMHLISRMGREPARPCRDAHLRDRRRLPERAVGDRGRRPGIPRRCAVLPGGPAPPERPGGRRVGRVALHVGRPRGQAPGCGEPDRGRARRRARQCVTSVRRPPHVAGSAPSVADSEQYGERRAAPRGPAGGRTARPAERPGRTARPGHDDGAARRTIRTTSRTGGPIPFPRANGSFDRLTARRRATAAG